MSDKVLFSREEMQQLNTETLLKRGITIEDMAKIAFDQQSRYTDEVSLKDCIESVEKILSLRDVFHIVQLGAEIDRMTEEGLFQGPIQAILRADLGMFGVDELFGLDVAGLYGVIGQTNFGDIDVNKPGIVNKLNDDGKDSNGMCHTFMDDIVGAIAAAASTRVAQMMNEDEASRDHSYKPIRLF